MLAYFDCFSGISGDMTLGALVDLGVPTQWLKAELQRMPLTGFEIDLKPKMRMGINASDITVRVLDKTTNRNYRDIRQLIENSPFSSSVKELSLKIFYKIAQAESVIHACPLETVHFHEIGGIDALVDIVGSALGLEYLGVTQAAASHIPLGKGFVNCRHGTLPVPAPAALAVLKGIPVYGTDIPLEITTPTGAAIIAAITESFGHIPDMKIHRIGYGSGKHDLPQQPNLLRVVLGVPLHEKSEIQQESIIIIETCLDDISPEILGYTMERLFEDGALDVYLTPIYMKKNRPGTLMTALCRKDAIESLTRRIFTETGTLGVRWYEAGRRILSRDTVDVETSFGQIKAKLAYNLDGSTRIIPEYEICKQIANQQDIPLQTVYQQIKNKT